MPEFPLSWEHSLDLLGHMVALGSWTLCRQLSYDSGLGVCEGLSFSKSLSALNNCLSVALAAFCVYSGTSRWFHFPMQRN